MKVIEQIRTRYLQPQKTKNKNYKEYNVHILLDLEYDYQVRRKVVKILRGRFPQHLES